MRFQRIIVLIFSLTLGCTGPSICFAGEIAVSDKLAEFLERYRCPVIARLAKIHSSAGRETELDRYLILSTERSQNYVQCRFVDDDKRMLCEASSGFFGPKEGEVGHYQMDPNGIDSLARLGFSMDGTQGNYQAIIDSPEPAAYGKVAEFLLSALYGGYSLSLDTQIMINMAKDHERKIEDCSNLPTG